MTRSHLTRLAGGRPVHALVPTRSHVTVRPTPTMQARQAGHPSVYDHTLDPDRPTLPDNVAMAVAVLVQYARATATRLAVRDAADLVDRYFRHGDDDCPPHGITRPGGA